MNGILNINKPAGLTSHQVVEAVRRLLPGIKVGHAGTLDPAATGVLPVCLGRATRIVEYLMEMKKGYQAGVVLGVITDTEDAQGEIIAEYPVPVLKERQIRELFQSLQGSLEQYPPAYSAVKYRGKPLYYWTRKGKPIERRPREVYIYQLELLEYRPTGRPHLMITVECSRGTYIRTLAVEIGRRRGCGAHLMSLERVFVGPFTIADACTLDELERVSCVSNDLAGYLIPLDAPLDHLNAVTVDETGALCLKHGKTVPLEQLDPLPEMVSAASLPVRVYDRSGAFLALARWQNVEESVQLKTEKYLA